MIYYRKTLLLALCTCLMSMIVLAGNESDKPAQAPKAGFRAEMLMQLQDVEKKIEDLADAIPAGKYTWRPAEGVRSISEVYMHIIGSNYFFMTFVGVKAPKMEKGMETTVTDKAMIAKKFKPSFEHFRNTILNLSDQDLDKSTEMFGSPSTYRNVLITALSHLHEHLGQSIAYARMNGVVPPWTAAQQAAAAEKAAKEKK